MRLNPYYPDWYLWYLADAYITMGRHADVIATVQRMQNPDEGRRMLAASYAHLGMMDEAREQARAGAAPPPGFHDRPLAPAPALSRPGGARAVHRGTAEGGAAGLAAISRPEQRYAPVVRSCVVLEAESLLASFPIWDLLAEP